MLYTKRGSCPFFKKVFAKSTNTNGATKLNTAIAYFIHSKSLTFPIPNVSKFEIMIWASKHVSTEYATPSSQAIAGSLLDCNYKDHMMEAKKNHSQDSDTFGITFHWDGTKTNKHPIMAALIYDLWCLLDVNECSNQMADGGLWCLIPYIMLHNCHGNDG